MLADDEPAADTALARLNVLGAEVVGDAVLFVWLHAAELLGDDEGLASLIGDVRALSSEKEDAFVHLALLAFATAGLVFREVPAAWLVGVVDGALEVRVLE